MIAQGVNDPPWIRFHRTKLNHDVADNNLRRREVAQYDDVPIAGEEVTARRDNANCSDGCDAESAG